MNFSFNIANVLGAVYDKGEIKFSPDGNSLYSPVGKRVVLYDLKSNKSRTIPTQFQKNIERIAIHPLSTIALLASEQSQLYIVSLISGCQLHMKEYKKFPKISHLSFSPDSRFYCIAGQNLALVYVTSGTVVRGNKREIFPFKLLRKFKVHHDDITSVSWTSNSSHICFGSNDMSLTIYDLSNKQTPFIHLRGHNDSVMGCFFANSTLGDKTIYSVSKNCQLIIWQEVADKEIQEPPLKKIDHRIRYRLTAKKFLKPENVLNCTVTSVDYSSKTNLLVFGYNTGNATLFKMPNADLIYELSRDFGPINSININSRGDWIALSSSPEIDDKKANSSKSESNLLVWEWQSESYTFDRIGSGSAESNVHECIDFSPDGNSVVAGNHSGRIKVWDCATGDTIAMFGEEHTGPIRAIRYAPNKSGKVVISASTDGTIRAYSLQNLKNFRVFKSPVAERKPEFICLDVDASGEFIAAGTYNYFEIYLFSLKTGKFLEFLTGHEGPVTNVYFSPTSNSVISSSWDNSVRVWNLFEQSKVTRDVVSFSKEVVGLAFRPDGNQFASATSDGQIAIFNAFSSEQIGAAIEGASDLETGFVDSTITKNAKKYFSSLNYSVDGNFILASGIYASNYICIYHVEQKVLVKKFPMTSITHQIKFSPTMRSFIAATLEGVLVYSLDVKQIFEPYKLHISVEPEVVRKELQKSNFGSALQQSIQLNDNLLFVEIFESIPLDQMDAIILSLSIDYVEKLLSLIAKNFQTTQHLEYYLTWIQQTLYKHGTTLKANNISLSNLQSLLNSIYGNLKGNCDYSGYSLSYLTRMTI